LRRGSGERRARLAPRHERRRPCRGDAKALRRGNGGLVGRGHRERLFHGVTHELVHRTAFTEAHLDLGRMYVDVDLPRLDHEPERISGLAIVVQHVAIRLAQRVSQHAVAHEAPIHEQILRVARGGRVRRSHRPAGKRQAGARDGRRRGLRPEGIAQQRIDARATAAAQQAIA
jgi:hypothetical protein